MNIFAETFMPVTQAKYKTIALVVRQHTDGIEEPVQSILDFLHGLGHTVVFEAETAAHLELPSRPAIQALSAAEIGAVADAAIVMGGDGTMLGIARQLAPFDVPLIGINQGRLGFMTDIPLERMLPVLADILAGKFKAERRTLLEGSVLRDGQAIHFGLAVNDVVVSRGAGAGMAELKVEVDGHFMYNQRSDGLIIATPTGSTAYALSAGGPLLHPSLGGIVLVPIAPHALSNRPIVVPDSSQIVVEIMRGRDISVNFDMQTFASLSQHDRIIIRRSPHTITFLHPEGWSYYDTLREKLHWNEYPSGEGKLN
ncbi:ATP-NAD kinase family protein [Janthinobacterium agaricidamnosum NBRC 102515 = DSM 9628]|uniref:NAD kinase n=2 Tax=Janthinobacterium agaricidamnosum TaxID=55508 RepID=W0UZS6_9BURK|nr:ATP-NAD kinase family protein [Janthinobacterium agaricidamnosum NBRC 102515 = DSM 9628]